MSTTINKYKIELVIHTKKIKNQDLYKNLNYWLFFYLYLIIKFNFLDESIGHEYKLKFLVNDNKVLD